MSVTRTISLTQHTHINNGSHVLYFYGDDQSYIDNAASFIKAGFDLHQQ
ncbi:hypothetical protein RAC89_08340 [Paenibacillus sp. GD4]|nr:hypothetical protein [Paenibacillus sp. GD4]MDQ1910507.1 hypothetical protein [Paenibacillus sp. GD4]